MAVKDETVIKLHQKFHELLHPSNIGVDMMHNMGWSFVNGLAWIMDQLEGITDNVLSFLVSLNRLQSSNLFKTSSRC